MKYNQDTNVPFCQPGMGVQAAYANGYKHGAEGVVTRGICTLIRDTDEWKEWQRGYTNGENALANDSYSFDDHGFCGGNPLEKEN